jgi:hypothetical protein
MSKPIIRDTLTGKVRNLERSAAEQERVTTFGSWFSVPVFGNEVSFPSVANRLWAGRLFVLAPTTLTGIAFYNGTTINGNIRVALYNSALNKVAEKSTNTAQGAINTVQKVNFDSSYDAMADFYYAAVIHSSTGHFYVGKAAGPSVLATQGSFTTPASIAPGDPASTASVVPWLMVY